MTTPRETGGTATGAGPSAKVLVLPRIPGYKLHVSARRAIPRGLRPLIFAHVRLDPRRQPRHRRVRALPATARVLPPRGARQEARVPRLRSEEHTSELQSQSNLVCRL